MITAFGMCTEKLQRPENARPDVIKEMESARWVTFQSVGRAKATDRMVRW